MATKKQSVSWSIPFAVHKQKTIQEIRQAFPAIGFVRIAIVFTVIFLPIRFMLPRWLPDLAVDWTQLYFVSLLSMFGIIVPVCLGAFYPARITIKSNGILIQSAQRCILHRFIDIAGVRIDENAKPFAMMKISFLGQQKEKEYPIAATVPLDVLEATLNELRFSR